MKGLQGELIAMQTRTDATLADNLTPPPVFFQKVKGAVMQVIVYTKSMNRDSRNALLWMIVFLGVIMAGISLAKINNDYGFGLRFASSVTMLSILFTFANCNLLTSSKSGKEPWVLLLSGDKSKTQSVNGGTTYHGGGNGFATGIIPVTGMYFVHSDHLGSVTMLTDGYGNPVTGGEYGGKSYISYKPYGEILRTDSGGPDISKFKYTGQEEDRESGLMYYKARYYDPYLARFLEADSVTNSNSLFGMNRYMYVEGNPVRFSDPTGHWKVSHITEGKWARNLGGGISLAMKAGDFRNYNFQNANGGMNWASGGLHRAGDFYNTLTGRRKYQGKNDFRRGDIGGIHGGKAWDSIIGKDGFFGWLGNAIGWKHTTKWWDYQTKDKELDYNRELIGGIIEEKICSENPKSADCRNIKIARGIDRNAQSKKYYNKRRINLTYFYTNEGSGNRIECSIDSRGGRKCFIVPEEIVFNPDI